MPDPAPQLGQPTEAPIRSTNLHKYHHQAREHPRVIGRQSNSLVCRGERTIKVFLLNKHITYEPVGKPAQRYLERCSARTCGPRSRANITRRGHLPGVHSERTSCTPTLRRLAYGPPPPPRNSRLEGKNPPSRSAGDGLGFRTLPPQWRYVTPHHSDKQDHAEYQRRRKWPWLSVRLRPLSIVKGAIVDRLLLLRHHAHLLRAMT